jgi:hypothetical protein
MCVCLGGLGRDEDGRSSPSQFESDARTDPAAAARNLNGAPLML